MDLRQRGDALRNEPSLLDTRIPFGMFTSRVFFLGLIAIFGTGFVRAQDTAVDPPATKKSATAPAEPPCCRPPRDKEIGAAPRRAADYLQLYSCRWPLYRHDV